MKMLDREDQYSPTSVVRSKIEESSLSSQFDSSSPTTAKKKKYKKKKRFSDEQIKSLETMFESETKLDPRMKLQLAKELSLQPRQVAIWFQNRRARWKSKQLERDYSILRANYDDLASKYESLKNDNQSLMIQLQKLNDLLGKPREAASSWSGLGLAGHSTDGDSDNGDAKYGTETKPGQLLDGLDLRVAAAAACSDDENSKHLEYFGQEDEAELMNIGEPAACGMLASQEDWCSYDSSTDLFDHSCNSSSQWWEIWP